MNDMHQMREVESPVGAPGPAAVAAEELAGAAVTQQPFHRILEIHRFSLPQNERNKNGVNTGEFLFGIMTTTNPNNSSLFPKKNGVAFHVQRRFDGLFDVSHDFAIWLAIPHLIGKRSGRIGSGRSSRHEKTPKSCRLFGRQS